MRWSEKETYQFVTIYLRHECLWNYDSPHHKMKANRAKAYDDLIAEFRAATGIRLDENELKQKIRNLRSTYAQEVKKVRLRSVDFYTPAMKWFPLWHKCYDGLKRYKRRGDGSDTQDADVSDSRITEESIIWTETSNENDNGDDTDPFISETTDEYKAILKSEPHEIKITNNLYKMNNKNKLEYRNSSTDCSDTTYRVIESGSESGVREDEFDIYGKYIATQLRKMDLQKALRVQLEIQSIVSEARISGFSSN